MDADTALNVFVNLNHVLRLQVLGEKFLEESGEINSEGADKGQSTPSQSTRDQLRSFQLRRREGSQVNEVKGTHLVLLDRLGRVTSALRQDLPP